MYIYGIHPVEEVLRRAPELIEQIVVAGGLKDAQFEEIKELVRISGVKVQRVSTGELDEWSDGGNHQRIAVRVSEFPYMELADAIDKTAEKQDACILALAQVQDPGNLGAILRTAAALKVDAVMIPRHRSAQITPAVIRASAGMAFRVPLVQVTNLSKALQELKEEGFWVVGTVAEEGQDLWTMDWGLKAAVVMGGEHKGMRPGVEKQCDFRLTIPVDPGVESLNVSVAAAITLYDRMRNLSGS